jgi:integrase
VFYHPESLTRWHSCRDAWEEARIAAGFPWLRIHDLRHAYGIKLAERGVPMHFISEVMGHHSVDFTRKQYARFSPESASRAVLRGLEGGRISTNLPLSAV